MDLQGSMILRAGITWGIVGIVLAILGAVLGPVLPEVGSLTLGTYALLMAGVHYATKARTDFLQSMVGGGLSGLAASVLLYFVRFLPSVEIPTPADIPTDILLALVAGFLAGAAGGLGMELIDR